MLVDFEELKRNIKAQKSSQNTNDNNKPFFKTKETIIYYSQCYPTPTTKKSRNNKNVKTVCIEFL
jgi:hypothetical protein